MKTILIALSAASLLVLGSSCRVAVPVDPNTGELDCRMMPDDVPDNFGPDCTPCASKGEVKASK